jgi:hypothetical protein
MKALFFSLALIVSIFTFATSGSAQASDTPTVMRVGLTTGYIDGFGTITIVPEDKNEVAVTVDQRNSDGSEVYVVPEMVVPQLIDDESAADGSILLRLTNRLFLQITRSLKGSETVRAIYKGKTPTAPDRIFDLKSFVSLEPVSFGNHQE